MFNFVAVLPMLLAVASAGVLAPVAGPLAYAHAHPYGYAAHTHAHGINIAHGPALSYSAPAINHIAAPVAHTHYAAAPAFSYAAAPALQYAAAPALQYAPALSYAAAPVAIAAPITKTVHYENRPVVTGYTSQILKPAFPGGAGLATPEQIVTKQAVLAPARSVETVIPQITQVEPEVHIQKVAIDVPVAKHVPVEHVVRTVAAPAHITVAAAPAHISYAAAPVAFNTVAAGPAHLSYAAAPAAWSANAAWNTPYAAYGYGVPYGHGYGYGANLVKTVY